MFWMMGVASGRDEYSWNSDSPGQTWLAKEAQFPTGSIGQNRLGGVEW